MKIKLLHTITAGKTGDTIEVTAAGGRKLIALGVAEEVKAETKPAPKRRSRTKNAETTED